MYKTLPTLVVAVILIDLSIYAEARPVRQTSSAASLQNVQGRSTVQQELPQATKVTSELSKRQAQKTFTSRDSNRSLGLGDELDELGDKLDIRVGSRSSRSLSGVFPQENMPESGGVRVLYKLDQE